MRAVLDGECRRGCRQSHPSEMSGGGERKGEGWAGRGDGREQEQNGGVWRVLTFVCGGGCEYKRRVRVAFFLLISYLHHQYNLVFYSA
jgi:hypothetical protein